jgi:hypothetical protein
MQCRGFGVIVSTKAPDHAREPVFPRRLGRKFHDAMDAPESVINDVACEWRTFVCRRRCDEKN